MIEAKLIAKIKERQQELAKQLVEVPVGSFDKYQNIVGKYQGLQEAHNLLSELIGQEEDEM